MRKIGERISYKEGELIGECIFLKDTTDKPRRKAIFKCKCGKEFEARISHIKGGKIRSCGCFLRKIAAEKSFKHGMARRKKVMKEYRVFKGMINRCYNSNTKCYKHYGGRGIKVCDRWLDKERGIINFMEDMGERPNSSYSLDRINNDGNYEPSNCRWATKKEQARNTRTNTYIEYKGERKLLLEWAELLGIQNTVIAGRLKRGYTVEEALETPY